MGDDLLDSKAHKYMYLWRKKMPQGCRKKRECAVKHHCAKPGNGQDSRLEHSRKLYNSWARREVKKQTLQPECCIVMERSVTGSCNVNKDRHVEREEGEERNTIRGWLDVSQDSCSELAIIILASLSFPSKACCGLPLPIPEC